MNDIEYKAKVDFERFKNLFLAQNKNYFRKLGSLCSIIFIPLTILFVIMFVGKPTGENFLYVLVSLLLTILGLLFIFKPFFVFYTRRNLVTKWFYFHGLKDLKQDFKEYKIEYDVILSKLGVTEKFVSGNEVRFPWFTFTGKYVEFPEGVYFIYDDGKNSSVFYNMLGVNYLFREELQGETLFIEKDVLDKNPNLLEDIKKLIEESRKKYKNRKIPEEEKQELLKWLESVNGEKNSKNLLLVLPAGKAAHIESGIAFGLGKKCYAIGEYEATDTLYNIFDKIFSNEIELEDFLTKYSKSLI